MVPLFLAGVDLNTFGFRRVFSFISPCHWRYCPLPQRRGLASAQNHEFTTQSETRFIFQLHFVTTIPTLTHINGKRFLLRPVFLFIVFIGLFGLVLLRIFPFKDRWVQQRPRKYFKCAQTFLCRSRQLTSSLSATNFGTLHCLTSSWELHFHCLCTSCWPPPW